MYYFLIFTLFFWISRIKIAIGLIDIQSIYWDLEYFNKTCDRQRCSFRSRDSVQPDDCHCEADCVQFDTCCLDSPYVQVARPKLKPTCRRIHNSYEYYFMVDRCPTSDSVWESQCREELSYGEDDEILKIAPVTSLFTSLTYKNYYCFKCHENNDEHFFWKVKLKTEIFDDDMPDEEIKSYVQNNRYNLTSDDGAWIASFRNDSYRFRLQLSIEIPQEIQPLLKQCKPDIIMNCSAECTDSEMREKCQAYTDVREIYRDYYIFRYRNMHCALCNFEQLDDITCTFQGGGVGGFGGVCSGSGCKTPFSFTHLLDINRSDGDKVGKLKRCDDDHVWDPYAEKCRKLTCALPGYKIKNGKCEPQ